LAPVTRTQCNLPVQTVMNIKNSAFRVQLHCLHGIFPLKSHAIFKNCARENAIIQKSINSATIAAELFENLRQPSIQHLCTVSKFFQITPEIHDNFSKSFKMAAEIETRLAVTYY
jgi:hypothetical protein